VLASGDKSETVFSLDFSARTYRTFASLAGRQSWCLGDHAFARVDGIRRLHHRESSRLPFDRRMDVTF
jgi:hypothetical protein